VIPYDTLQEKLDINNVRDLEDLIIDCIYQGLLTGKLDQRKSILSVRWCIIFFASLVPVLTARCTQVDETFGRDVPKENLGDLAKTLQNWSAQADVLLKNIEDRLAWAQKENEAAKKHKEDFSKKMDEMKATIKAAMDADGGSGDNFQGGFDGDYMDDKRRKGRAKGKNPRGDDRPKADRDRRLGRNM
jgi:COP9 signalosome complex subunit 7